MNKIIGIIIVSLIVCSLSLIPSVPDHVYEEVVVTDYRHKSFLESSVTTVKFPDGDVRICKNLPYRDNGDKLIGRRSGGKFWKLK